MNIPCPFKIVFRLTPYKSYKNNSWLLWDIEYLGYLKYISVQSPVNSRPHLTRNHNKS